MTLWRLVRARHAQEPLSTEGAERYGGRWNPPGVPVLYCSATLALAALEILVHVRAGMLTMHFVAVEIEIPETEITTLVPERLPATWRSIPCDPATQAVGRDWVESGRSLALAVPSVIVPREHNVLISGRHPDFENVRVVSTTPFPFDPRLSPRA